MKVVVDSCILYGHIKSGILQVLVAQQAIEAYVSVKTISELQHLQKPMTVSATVIETTETPCRSTLPDPDDTAILAAAVAIGGVPIITDNLKDFRRSILRPLGVEAYGFDQWLCRMLRQLTPEANRALGAYCRQYSAEQLLNSGCKHSLNRLKQLS